MIVHRLQGARRAHVEIKISHYYRVNVAKIRERVQLIWNYFPEQKYFELQQKLRVSTRSRDNCQVHENFRFWYFKN